MQICKCSDTKKEFGNITLKGGKHDKKYCCRNYEEMPEIK